MKPDIYQQITDRILATVDDAGQWKPAWVGTAISRATNAATGNFYQGSNIITLWIERELNGYAHNQWASYKQWKQLGAQVKRGSKGAPVIFYKKVESDDPEKPSYLLARSSHVFNRDQVDDAPSLAIDEHDELTDEQRIANCDEWLTACAHRAEIETREEGRAYFNVTQDHIVLPPYAHFKTPERYYATAAHELVHWTGHKSRLNRDFFDTQNRQEYAKEELVAEIGAAFIAADLGIEPVTRDDHTAYIASWLKALKNDKTLIVRAASLAGKAVDYLHTIALENMEADEPDCNFITSPAGIQEPV